MLFIYLGRAIDNATNSRFASHRLESRSDQILGSSARLHDPGSSPWGKRGTGTRDGCSQEVGDQGSVRGRMYRRGLQHFGTRPRPN